MGHDLNKIKRSCFLQFMVLDSALKLSAEMMAKNLFYLFFNFATINIQTSLGSPDKKMINWETEQRIVNPVLKSTVYLTVFSLNIQVFIFHLNCFHKDLQYPRE